MALNPHLRWTTLLAGLSLLLTGTALTAQEEETEPTRLAVEYIVFEVDEDAVKSGETFPDDPGLPPVEEAVRAGSDGARDADMKPRSPEALLGMADSLEQAGDYQVLLHEAWELPERNREDSLAIRVFRDDRSEETDGEGNGAPSQNRFTDEHLADRRESEAEDEAETPDIARPLDGTLKIYHNRYYHVAADLLFNPEVGAERQSEEDMARERARRIDDLLAGRIDFEEYGEREAADEDRFLGYRLTDSRRIGTGEYHYLDHPRFGVIVHIREISP